MSRRKRVIQSVERDKTWAEKIPFAYCRCGHGNTTHAGATGDCAVVGCKCQEFKERFDAPEPPSSFQEVKAIMGR